MVSLEGQVAWISEEGRGIGRAVALALSARGAHVLVTGFDEKAIGRVVGEIAHGGGKGRHLVVGAHERSRAPARARELFGRLDIVFLDVGAHADVALDAAAAVMEGPGRLLVMPPTAQGVDAELLALVGSTARAVAHRRITCNALVVAPSEPEVVAEYVVELCGPKGEAVTGRALGLGDS